MVPVLPIYPWRKKCLSDQETKQQRQEGKVWVLCSKTLKLCSYLLPADKSQDSVWSLQNKQLQPRRKMTIKPRKQLRKKLRPGRPPTEAKKPRAQSHWKKKSGLLPALKEPHKGNTLNCSRTHSILHSQGLGEAGWGQNSGEGNCGVNTKEWIKRDDQGKQRDLCFNSENSSFKISVSQRRSPLQHQ